MIIGTFFLLSGHRLLLRVINNLVFYYVLS